MAAGGRRLSDEDATFLTLERSGAGGYVPVGVVVHDRGFDDPAAIEHLTEVMARLLPTSGRRIVRDHLSPALPRWADVPGFDPLDQVLSLPPPGDGTLRAVLDWAGRWGRMPFAADRPPWRSVTFEGVTVDGVPGRMVQVTQLHHAIIDGQGGIRMAESYYQWEPDGGLPAMPPPVEPDERSALAHWREGWAEEGRKAGRLLRTAGRRLRWLASEPRAGSARVREVGEAFQRLRATMGTESLSPLLRRRSDLDRYDVDRVDVEAVRAGAKAMGGSFNDGVLAAVNLGLNRWHLDQGARQRALRLAMPINTRTDDSFEGNQISGAIMEMPLVDDPAIAVKTCADLTRAARSDADLLWLNDALRNLGNRMPKALMGPAIARAMRAIDVSVSNVRGAPVRQWVAGAEMLDTYGFLAGGGNLAVSLVARGRFASLGVVSCPEAVPDPDHLMARLREGFAAVAALAPSS